MPWAESQAEPGQFLLLLKEKNIYDPGRALTKRSALRREAIGSNDRVGPDEDSVGLSAEQGREA